LLSSEIEKLTEKWLSENAEKVDKNTWKCKRCGDVICGQGKRLSVHEGYSLFGQHSGFGKVEEIVFPYCHKCDGGIKYFNDINCIDF
jgi:hypothetical protein